MGVEKNRYRLVDGVEEKRCPQCFEWIAFNHENFYRNKSEPSGLEPYCKLCRNDVDKRYKAKRAA